MAPAAAFADITQEDYEISNVSQLKNELATMEQKAVSEEYIAKSLVLSTDPAVIKEFSQEKLDAAAAALESLGDVQMEYGKESEVVKEVDLGDGCWVKVSLKSEKIGSDITGISEPGISPLFFQDQSGHNPSTWKKYGDYRFTAEVAVFYGVAQARAKLHNDYTLDKSGITIKKGTAGGSASMLMSISPGSCDITDKYARTPGGSDVNMQCPFQVTYGYAPIEWTKTTIMYSTVRYVGIDTVDNEIHVTEVWSFKKSV